MSEDRTSGAAQEGRPRNWLERIGQFLQSEPKDKEDLLQFLNDAQQRALLDRDAVSMIEGVMEVSEMQVRDIMIPRSQMEVIEREAKLVDFLPVIIDSSHSRFPVIGENRDEVVGIILAKDLLPFVAQSESSEFNIREILRPAMLVPESKRLNVLLREFQTSRNHMAIVVDEYGGVAGLVTIEDVLEQIVGEIEDEHDVDDDENNILPAGEGRFTVRALTTIEDFNDHFGSRFSDEEFDTVAGLVMGAFGHMPKRGEEIELEGLRFTVQRADNRRIYLLEVVSTSQDEGDDAEADNGDILPPAG
ncbi:MAG: CBS domain-containing protein [Gammaproteobacteria bacterium]|nr:CBS domain-containing protein [Gammaproteobacteria bacterium]MCW8840208.1 CBS domain-containing protein [Gammaproteobacteria bacterium]MCW8927792.1 CBS domain-containing protein [Gammaproteobacteria bacterium]MCW8959674.1 CBS domain-containing protein [Gammaproteobacteria bacterium]MCW8973215.1 CBS domain-containing protein [Gammaproteobacteria bacterium]